MLRSHMIYYKASDNISAGDTLLIRFRLYSDPFANGWGWVIEDLKINPLIDAVEKVNFTQFKVYPNPGNGLINIVFDSDTRVSQSVRYSVINSSGSLIVNNRLLMGDETLIDISNNPAGIYIIIFYSNEGIKTVKYSLIK